MEFKKKKIIIADDSQTFLMYMGIILKRMGFTVIPAESGLEVLKLLRLTEPDLVMLDIIMDGIGGSAVLSSIKGDKQTSHIPVIMVSQDTSPETIEKCRGLGCSAFLSKPVKIDKLHEILQEYVFSSLGTRRKHVRVPFCMKVQVTFGGSSYDLYGETLAEGGMYIRKREPFPVGSHVDVTLDLNNGSPLQLKGVVVYTKGLFSSIFKYPPGMAVEFKGAGKHETGVLRDYIETSLAKDIFESQEEMVILPPDHRVME